MPCRLHAFASLTALPRILGFALLAVAVASVGCAGSDDDSAEEPAGAESALTSGAVSAASSDCARLLDDTSHDLARWLDTGPAGAGKLTADEFWFLVGARADLLETGALSFDSRAKGAGGARLGDLGSALRRVRSLLLHMKKNFDVRPTDFGNVSVIVRGIQQHIELEKQHLPR